MNSKDPTRQWINARNKAKGQMFEDRINKSFEYYSDKGFAEVEKTPEPMRVLQNLGGGVFKAVFTKKAQTDYKGTLKGGRTLLYEAKYTNADRMEQSRISEGQSQYMNKHEALGALCYVICGFGSGAVYLIPWNVWQNMKEHFGRKYIKEIDIQKYKLKTGWNGLLMII